VYRYTFDQYNYEWFDFEFVTFAQADGMFPHVRTSEELRDIDPRLYWKLEPLGLPARMYGECETGVRLKHPDFSGSGLLLWVGSVTFTSRTTAVVYAGYFGTELGAAGELLELTWNDRAWTVTHERVVWIS
jgi:hypothetical protein